MTIARRWTGDPDKDVTTSEKERDAVWYRLYGNGKADYLWRAERKRVLDKAVRMVIGPRGELLQAWPLNASLSNHAVPDAVFPLVRAEFRRLAG